MIRIEAPTLIFSASLSEPEPELITSSEEGDRFLLIACFDGDGGA